MSLGKLDGFVGGLDSVVLFEALSSLVDGAESGQTLLLELNEDLLWCHLVDIF